MLPQGWKAEWDERYSEWYYINIHTGISQWDKPSRPAHAPIPRSGSTPHVPRGWKAEWDEIQGAWYYANIHTKQSQWQKPTTPAFSPPSRPNRDATLDDRSGFTQRTNTRVRDLRGDSSSSSRAPGSWRSTAPTRSFHPSTFEWPSSGSQLLAVWLSKSDSSRTGSNVDDTTNDTSLSPTFVNKKTSFDTLCFCTRDSYAFAATCSSASCVNKDGPDLFVRNLLDFGSPPARTIVLILVLFDISPTITTHITLTTMIIRKIITPLTSGMTITRVVPSGRPMRPMINSTNGCRGLNRKDQGGCYPRLPTDWHP